jgi:DNA-binding transcriptional ArsR family regulator
LSLSNRSRGFEQPGQLAPTFAALGDKIRLQLISRLCNDGPMSITRLTYGTNVTRQAITKHLEVMRRVGLVRNTRRGRERIWQVEQRRLKEVRHCLELISRQWDDALGRLKKFVEE